MEFFWEIITSTTILKVHKKEIAQLNGFANMNFQKKSWGANLPHPGINRVKEHRTCLQIWSNTDASVPWMHFYKSLQVNSVTISLLVLSYLIWQILYNYLTSRYECAPSTTLGKEQVPGEPIAMQAIPATGTASIYARCKQQMHQTPQSQNH